VVRGGKGGQPLVVGTPAKVNISWLRTRLALAGTTDRIEHIWRRATLPRGSWKGIRVVDALFGREGASRFSGR